MLVSSTQLFYDFMDFKKQTTSENDGWSPRRQDTQRCPSQGTVSFFVYLFTRLYTRLYSTQRIALERKQCYTQTNTTLKQRCFRYLSLHWLSIVYKILILNSKSLNITSSSWFFSFCSEQDLIILPCHKCLFTVWPNIKIMSPHKSTCNLFKFKLRCAFL